jgi:hypothetical protein
MLAACGGTTARQDEGTSTDPTTITPTSSATESPETTDAAPTSSGDVDPTTGTTPMTASTTGPLDTSAGDELPNFDLGGNESGGEDNDATLNGTVYGPDGEMPVSGALVYVTDEEPEGIPQGVYCAECEELDPDIDATLTNPDGTFSLNTNSGDGKFLVVQKGQFLRINPIIIGPAVVQINDNLTTLPSENDPENGEYIPLIAVADANFDRLEDALGKFGLGDTIISNFEERVVPGTESFDLWENGRDPADDGLTSQGTLEELVSNPEALAQYHIIFVPCSSDVFVSALTPDAVQNIRDWVAAGGRWYVSDWSNEWLQLVFPEYQDLAGWTGATGSADNGSYDSLGMVLDDGLLDWLEALPAQFEDINPLNDEPHPALNQLPSVMTTDNWSGISQTLPVMVDDGMGGMVDVSHKVWLEGPGGDPAAVHPLTVTGQFGCGKIQFTSYHTAEFFNYVGLSPQELVLIYTILEIGVCQEDLPPPG